MLQRLRIGKGGAVDKRQGGAALLGTGRVARLCDGHLSGGQALRAGKTGCPGVVPRLHTREMKYCGARRVGTSSVSFASARARKLTHSTAPPSKTESHDSVLRGRAAKRARPAAGRQGEGWSLRGRRRAPNTEELCYSHRMTAGRAELFDRMKTEHTLYIHARA